MNLDRNSIRQIVVHLPDLERIRLRQVSKEMRSVAQEVGLCGIAAREMSDAFERRSDSGESRREYEFLFRLHQFARGGTENIAQNSIDWNFEQNVYLKLKKTFRLHEVWPALSDYVSESTPEVGDLGFLVPSSKMANIDFDWDVSWLMPSKLSHPICVGRAENRAGLVFLRMNAISLLIAVQDSASDPDSWRLGEVRDGIWENFLNVGLTQFVGHLIKDHWRTQSAAECREAIGSDLGAPSLPRAGLSLQWISSWIWSWWPTLRRRPPAA